MTTVSVIIPTYNRDQYILDAVKSVLKQKLPVNFDLEVIVVDDGSTDSTETVLKQFRDKIVYIKTTNSGRPAVPRNIGIKRARGDLIAFQDSDDLWDQHKFLNQLKLHSDDSVALSYGKVGTVSPTGKKQSSQLAGLAHKPSQDIFEQLVNANFISTLTVMATKKVLLEMGGFDESAVVRGVEDYELWLRIAANHKTAYVPKTLAYYRKHDDNISSSLNAEGDVHLYKLFLRIYRKEGFTSRQRVLILQRLLELVTHQNLGSLHKKILSSYFRLRIKLLRLWK